MLDSQQMPPVDAEQPSDAERAELRGWVRRMLKEEARRYAGDPGPVVLRRLSNAEYTYLIRDLTGVDSLEPAKEFPVDGAAGEGFTNAGDGLVMSPALLAKYLDAGKDVAAHAMLLPDGIRVLAGATPRDWTEQMLAEIRGIVQPLQRFPGDVARHFARRLSSTQMAAAACRSNATSKRLWRSEMRWPTGPRASKRSPASVALSPKYLGSLWKLMTAEPARPTSRAAPPCCSIRSAPAGRPPSLRTPWRVGDRRRPLAAGAVAIYERRTHRQGRRAKGLGRADQSAHRAARFQSQDSAAADGKEVVLYLVASDAGDGNEHDYVVWERPRLVAPGRPDLPLARRSAA